MNTVKIPPCPCRAMWLPVCLALAMPLATHADNLDGRWLLTIDGHNTYRYGEPQLGGGVQIPWRVEIHFQVVDGNYELGNGSARMLDKAKAFSHPPGWFHCEDAHGTYLDSSLTLHETPRIRFAAFPVSGVIDAGLVRLQPGYEPPGNYLAVTYECQSVDGYADDWFALAERGKQVMGKRQDAEKRINNGRRLARVREVMPLPPEDELAFPLLDGWRFSEGAPDSDRWIGYRLQRRD